MQDNNSSPDAQKSQHLAVGQHPKLSESQLGEIAQRHGVNLSDVVPRDPEQRLARLRQILDRQDVDFPISADRARSYYAAAEAGQLFSVGSLTEQSVDLGEYANLQHYDKYTREEHLSWACLVAEQQRTKHDYACREYIAGEEMFEIGGQVIPDYYALNARIYQQTGWQLATVNMIIPAELFFTCHSYRFFPVTTFMRPLEQDYLQEPDIGHDVAGHVATFTIPTVARLMQNHGLARDLIYAQRDERLAASRDDEHASRIRARADELLLYAERIYWFTVEFGLVQQDDSMRAYGAGILSSPGETRFSIDDVTPNRVLLDPSRESHLMRLVSTDYLISEFQKTYFVIEQFDLLDSLTPERIVAAAEKAARLPHFSWRDLIPGDRVLNVGQTAASPNEKYWRLLAGQPMDECMQRTAVRNIQLLRHGVDPLDDGSQIDPDRVWGVPMPALPEEVQQAVAQPDALENDCLLRPLSFTTDYL